MEMHCFERKNDKTIRRPYRIVFLDELILSEEDIGLYLAAYQEKAATIIQKNWRAQVVRKKINSIRKDILKEKAALKIQRFYRHWKYQQQIEYKPTISSQPLDRILEEHLPLLQSEINIWHDKHQHCYEGYEKLAERHHEVQQKLNKFYLHALASESRNQYLKQNIDELRTKICHLKDFSSLQDLDDKNESVDMTYNRLSFTEAKEARRKHREEIKRIYCPWWRKL